MCGHNHALYFETRKANSSSTQTGLVVFVTIRFSGVFVVPLYDYHNLFLIYSLSRHSI